MDTLVEIPVTDIGGVSIGQAQNEAAGTGCTVFLFGPGGAAAGLDVRGGGPASRESELLKPTAAAQRIHAVLLAGGSSFGLDAAGGVMRYLEERSIGFSVGITTVPLVCQSNLFDLALGDPFIRPDAAMGYAACEAAGNYRDGNFGAGTGASVGKACGMQRAMKSGIGSYALQLGTLKVGAVVAVNAIGDIYDRDTGKKIAGMRNTEGTGFADAEAALLGAREDASFAANTTIGVVLTNARLDKTRLCKVAAMAHDGYAASIRPVHTANDGDSIYAVSLPDDAAENIPADTVGELAVKVMSRAIVRAVTSAEAAYGLPAVRSLRQR